MKKFTVTIFLFSLLFVGCAYRNQANYSNQSFTGKQMQKKEPQFLGWDKNGYKQFDNDSTKSRNTQSTIIGNNAVILNEDTILCG